MRKSIKNKLKNYLKDSCLFRRFRPLIPVEAGHLIQSKATLVKLALDPFNWTG